MGKAWNQFKAAPVFAISAVVLFTVLVAPSCVPEKKPSVEEKAFTDVRGYPAFDDLRIEQTKDACLTLLGGSVELKAPYSSSNVELFGDVYSYGQSKAVSIYNVDAVLTNSSGEPEDFICAVHFNRNYDEPSNVRFFDRDTDSLIYYSK